MALENYEPGSTTIALSRSLGPAQDFMMRRPYRMRKTNTICLAPLNSGESVNV